MLNQSKKKIVTLNKVIIACICFITLVSCEQKNKTNMVSRTLKTGWTFKEINGTNSGNAIVPGTIHTDLLANQIIEDPFYRINEKNQQWIDKKDWEYATTLNISQEEFGKDFIELNFNGLDTYADVFVNDSLMLKTNNMFRTWQIDVKPFIKIGDNNLKVLLHSPIKKGLELLEGAPYVYPAINDQSENGEIGDKKVSIFTRKAGYHYGWDWGPRLVTSGIWRPVILKSWNTARINNVFIKQPSVTKELATLVCEVNLDLGLDFKGTIKVVDEENNIEYATTDIDLSSGKQKVEIPFSIKQPKLWWSKGLGTPNMYRFKIVLSDHKGNKISTKEVNTGLRSIKLIREKDEIGESFLFEVNGVRTFIKGANYIPNDNFIPRVTKNDYQKVIKDALDANMNMLRVWGGGIYEDDYFYELCDKNGLLVWQDFMFACSMYPGDDTFLKNVGEEAKDNIIRLRNHPSIALWCGNNEINAAWSHYSNGGWGWKEKYTEEQREEIQKAYLDIFHKVLPNTVKEYTDGDDYWPSSPQAGFDPKMHAGYENTSGDMHYWGVWHGKHPFKDFEKYKARFMSEYGFQSFPNFETVQKYALPEDFDIESNVMSSHQRSGIGNLTIKEYMGWDYNLPTDFKDFLYLSQVLQAKGVKMAIEAHRRAMPYCMGTMYWQINDCWPVASWSSTDYYHKWKALHYAVKKVYEPIIVTAHQEGKEIVVSVISDKLESISGRLKISVIDFNGKVLATHNKEVTIKANTSSMLLKVESSKLIGKNNQNKTVLKLELETLKENSIAKNLFYLVSPKLLILGKPEIFTELVIKSGKQYLKVTTDKLVKNLYINFKSKKVFIEDNYFDLLPNETRLLELTTDEDLNTGSLELKHLQNVK